MAVNTYAVVLDILGITVIRDYIKVLDKGTIVPNQVRQT